MFSGLAARIRHGGQYLHYRVITSSLYHGITKNKNTFSPADIGKCLEHMTTKFFFSETDKDEIIGHYRQTMNPNLLERVISDADVCLNNTFMFLGSIQRTFQRRIRWNTDVGSGQSWPVYRSKQIPVYLNKNADIIRVWELSRFQWGVTLGKAFWLSGESKYKDKIVSACLDWIKMNPVGFGPNWMSGQDVALRAVNWINSYCFISAAEKKDSDIWKIVFTSLYEHGLFIEKNLSLNFLNGIKTTGTHYLSEVMGLFYLGLLYGHLEKGRQWLDFSLSELVKEMADQVHEDGSDYESSIACYHRFALEHFITAYILCRLNQIEVSGLFLSRLEKMFDLVMAYTRPDGTVPQIGDTCDGRVQIFSEYGSWKKNDHRSTLAIGAGLFGREEQARICEDQGEEAFWLLYRLTQSGKLPQPTVSSKHLAFYRSVHFPESGFYFMRADKALLTIAANPVGMNGKGNHKHNDILSIDLFYNDCAFIIDPGSYVYTSDLQERYRFRSTAYHNVLQINDYEQNEIDIERPWRVEEKAQPRVIHWESNADYDLFIGQHRGFSRYLPDLYIQRKIYFNRQRYFWIIEDSFVGDEPHSANMRINIYFHLNDLYYELNRFEKTVNFHESEIPDIFKLAGNRKVFGESIVLRSEKSELSIYSARDNRLQLAMAKGWISESYAKRKAAPVAVCNGIYSGQNKFFFLLETNITSE